MITLDVSNLSSNYSKTLLYYLCSIYEGYNVEKCKIEAFIKNDIGCLMKSWNN
jgi:hypothetical protein